LAAFNPEIARIINEPTFLMLIDDLEAIILRDAIVGQRIVDNVSNAFPLAAVVDFAAVDTNEGPGNSLLTDRRSCCSSYQHILTLPITPAHTYVVPPWDRYSIPEIRRFKRSLWGYQLQRRFV
jgi:hypothetical protein